MKSLLIPGAMLLTLTACPGDGTGPGDDGNVFRFSHTAAGALLPSGAYEARGEARFGGQGQLVPGEWVLGTAGIPPGDYVRVMASRRSALTNGRYDFVLLEMPASVQAGASLRALPTCSNVPNCASLRFTLGVRAQGDQTPQMTCDLDEGTLTVTARSETRIQGTFSGPGACYAPGGSAPYQVTGGTFDVSLQDWS